MKFLRGLEKIAEAAEKQQQEKAKDQEERERLPNVGNVTPKSSKPGATTVGQRRFIEEFDELSGAVFAPR